MEMKKYVVVGKVTSPHDVDKGVPNMHQHEVVGGDDKSEEVCGPERRKCMRNVKWNEEGVIYRKCIYSSRFSCAFTYKTDWL